jgi:mono/diheme cytochrome c family protein
MHVVQRFGGVIAAVLAAAAPFSAQAAGDLAQGKATAERWCSSCHAVGATGRATDTAPSFGQIAQTRTESYLRTFLSSPHPPMPRFEISRQDIEDLVAYIESQRRS